MLGLILTSTNLIWLCVSNFEVNKSAVIIFFLTKRYSVRNVDTTFVIPCEWLLLHSALSWLWFRPNWVACVEPNLWHPIHHPQGDPNVSVCMGRLFLSLYQFRTAGAIEGKMLVDRFYFVALFRPDYGHGGFPTRLQVVWVLTACTTQHSSSIKSVMLCLYDICVCVCV